VGLIVQRSRLKRTEGIAARRGRGAHEPRGGGPPTLGMWLWDVVRDEVLDDREGTRRICLALAPRTPALNYATADRSAWHPDGPVRREPRRLRQRYRKPRVSNADGEYRRATAGMGTFALGVGGAWPLSKTGGGHQRYPTSLGVSMDVNRPPEAGAGKRWRESEASFFPQHGQHSNL